MTDKPDNADRAPPSVGRGQGGRFAPGNSFSPGRAAGSRARALLELDAVGQERTAEIIRALAERAVAGDNTAADILLKRTWTPRRTRPVTADLPKIETRVDAIAALGRLTEATA